MEGYTVIPDEDALKAAIEQNNVYVKNDEGTPEQVKVEEPTTLTFEADKYYTKNQLEATEQTSAAGTEQTSTENAGSDANAVQTSAANAVQTSAQGSAVTNLPEIDSLAHTVAQVIKTSEVQDILHSPSSATLAPAEAPAMYNIDGEKGVGEGFIYSNLDAINTARSESDPPKERLTELKSGGRRRTRRRNKKGGKKSRRQSKKGGKNHRKSAKTGSKKSKKSRRYSSRK